MPEAIDASSIATNYYKLAHLGAVSYLIYTVASGTSDQTLLELELVIRYANPKRLITYYNKCLYCFQLNHAENEEDLRKEYPQLELKYFNLVSADLLANPPKQTAKDNTFKNDYLAYASLSFLKAVKKLVLFNLSKNDVVQPFGNYAVLKRKELSNSFVHIDPILLPNGDLLLSVSENCHLELFQSSIVDINQIESIDMNFVIYIIPSGIRCHLYDNANIASNFTTEPPKNSEVLLQLIKYSTSIDIKRSDTPLVWVKLVPNLQHLNNQTSKISKFIHPVDNKKFILWPWILCMLQFGFTEENVLHATDSSPCDPLGLISDFIDFNIGHHQHTNIASQLNPGNHNNQSFNYSIPSAVSTGMSSTGIDNKGDLSVVGEIPGSILAIFGIQSSDTNDFFNGSNLQTENPDEVKLTSEEPLKKHTDEDDVEMDDLFGDESEDEKPIIDGSENKIKDEELHEDLFNNDGHSEKDISKKEGDSKFSAVHDNVDAGNNDSEENDTLEELKDYKDSKLQISTGTAQNTFIDIPRDQMTIQSFKNLKQTPQIYNDPGAPMPIIPTPIFPQSGVNSAAPVSTQPINPPTGTENEANDGARSIFSPILFNPIIKSNIDTKYGKGGKFYVDKEVSAGPDIDSKRRSFRATSVNGFELPLRKDDGLGIEAVNEDTKLILELSEEQGNVDDAKIQDREETMNKKNLEDIHDDEIDDNDDEDEESDEDEELNMEVNDINLKRSPPLKLNMLNDPYIAPQAQVGLNFSESNQNGKPLIANSYNASSLNTGGYSSPTSLGFNHSKFNVPLKYDSPLGFNNLAKEDLMQATFPVAESGEQVDSKNSVSENSPIGVDTDVEKKFTDKQTDGTPSGVNTPNFKGFIVSESSNCLPLILRGINVSSIPSFFILSNAMSNNMSILTNFDMDMEDENESSDYELSKNNEMTVKLNNLDEFLKWLGPNLIFDMGMNKLQKSLIMKLPNNERMSEDFVNIEGKAPSQYLEDKLYDIFPLSYRVNLNEFTTDTSFNEPNDQSNSIQEEIDNQLSFLDEITNEDILNPKTQLKKLSAIEWDSIYPEKGKNEANAKNYKEIVHNVCQSSLVNTLEHDGTVFPLTNNKTRVLKHDTILNLNSSGIKFWKYLNFSPLNGPKNFQLLLISEHDYNMFHLNYNMDFVNSLVYNYKECGFGNISRINLQPSDNRTDLEGIDNGLLLVNRENSEQGYGNIYKQINHKLSKLVELIKLDLINKTNRFEFDRPLLLLFINFDKSINSLLQISKLMRNFKLFLSHHQLPLVEAFAHIIPASLIIKQSAGHRRLKYLSNFKLSKLSMNLYNQCPNECTVGNTVKDPTKHLFTQLFREPPSNLNFKFMNNGGSGNGKTTFNDDIFLHLAYERSIDKNWVSAAWSDPLGIVVSTKSWNCSPTLQKSGNKNVHSLEAISDEIWATSIILFKKLNDEVIKRTSGLGGKKFLVLTRINSIIPDDELIHWKRLSLKHKDISLIVLSVNKSPKLLFAGPLGLDEKPASEPNDSAVANNLENNPTILSGTAAISGSTSNALAPDFFKNFSSSYADNSPQNNNSGAISVSPSNNGINFHSPQQFFNVPGNFLSPQDLVSSASVTTATGNNHLPSGGQDMTDVILHDPTEELTAVIPRAPLPSFNSPTRLGMKIGYLIKDIGIQLPETTKQYLVYEVNLLSCSNYWNLNAIMRILLNQYKKLITLNDILCVGDIHGCIPEDSTEEEKIRPPEKNTSLNHIASGLVPWHIAAVSKSLDYLVHIDVEE